MKISMHFTLPEEQEDFDAAIKGRASERCIEELDEYLRQKLKYGDLKPEEADIYFSVRTQLNLLREEYECK